MHCRGGSELLVGAERVDSDTEFVILASIGIWEVLKQEPKITFFFFFLTIIHLKGIKSKLVNIVNIKIFNFNILMFVKYRFSIHIVNKNFNIFNMVHQAMKPQEAVNLIRHLEDPQEAAECLAKEAITRMSKSNISCLIIKFD